MNGKSILPIAALLVWGAGCGSDSPSTPSPPPPAQVSGTWRGTATATSVSGGECFAAAFAAIVGQTAQITASISQAGSSLNATVSSPSTGSGCNYSGTAGQSAVMVTTTLCSASDITGVPCPGSGLVRDIKLQTSVINGTVNGNTITGTETDAFNIFAGGTTTSVG